MTKPVNTPSSSFPFLTVKQSPSSAALGHVLTSTSGMPAPPGGTIKAPSSNAAAANPLPHPRTSRPYFSHLFCILQAVHGHRGERYKKESWGWVGESSGSVQKKAHTKWRNVSDFTHGKQKTTRAYANNKKMHSGLVSVAVDVDVGEVLRWSFPGSLHLFIAQTAEERGPGGGAAAKLSMWVRKLFEVCFG